MHMEALDKGLGSMGMDYGMILGNFTEMLSKIRQLCP